MKSWAELAAERRRMLAGGSGAPSAAAMPDVKHGNRAKQPSVAQVTPQEQIETRSTFGTVGTFDSRHGDGGNRSEVVSPLLAVQDAVRGPLADPTDFIERIAILADAGIEDAEVQALDEAGFQSWEAYADALATYVKGRIEAARAATTGPLGRHWHALAQHSLGFLSSPWWLLACRLGWSLVELFGVRLEAPLVRIDGWGLASAPALSSLTSTQLVELTGDAAAFATQSGDRLSWPRFRGQRPELAVPWWELADSNARHQAAIDCVVSGGTVRPLPALPPKLEWGPARCCNAKVRFG
jgi:hypothetical protein